MSAWDSRCLVKNKSVLSRQLGTLSAKHYSVHECSAVPAAAHLTPERHVMFHAGHLMCAEAGPEGGDACSARVRNLPGASTCPTCRAVLARAPIRVISAEQSIAALPAACRHCAAASTRGEVLGHEAQCPRAPAQCAAGPDGCRWEGPAGEREAHEATCVWGRATGNTTEANRTRGLHSFPFWLNLSSSVHCATQIDS